MRDWQASGSVLAYSGQPFTPKASGTQDLGQATRPNRLCNGTLSNRTITQWFDPACFAIPASGFGNSGRNILSGPDSVTVNLALGRVFSLGEYGHFEFRWETFGTLNHPSFGYPSSTIGTAATAGVINSTNGAIASCNSAGVTNSRAIYSSNRGSVTSLSCSFLLRNLCTTLGAFHPKVQT